MGRQRGGLVSLLLLAAAASSTLQVAMGTIAPSWSWDPNEIKRETSMELLKPLSLTDIEARANQAPKRLQ